MDHQVVHEVGWCRALLLRACWAGTVYKLATSLTLYCTTSLSARLGSTRALGVAKLTSKYSLLQDKVIRENGVGRASSGTWRKVDRNSLHVGIHQRATLYKNSHKHNSDSAIRQLGCACPWLEPRAGCLVIGEAGLPVNQRNLCVIVYGFGKSNTGKPSTNDQECGL